jgi:aspartate/methionine/tyrosine aminotransferase
MMPLFEEGLLNNRQTLEIKNAALKAFIEHEVNRENFPPDQRFTYYLLAATGICVVPATGFYSPDYGFRLTTLDRDDARRKDTYSRLSQAVKDYLASEK